MSDLDAVVVAIRDCVRDALAATVAGAPARICEVPGQLAWDECDCGVLAVTVDRLYFSTVFPQEAAASDLSADCPPPYFVADLAVTVLRCAPSPDRNGNPPSCAQLTASSVTWFLDLDAVRNGIACCLADLRAAGNVEEYTVKDQVPVGPEGGCVGSVSRLSVALLNCLCPVPA